MWPFAHHVLSASHPRPNSFHFDQRHNIREEVKNFKWQIISIKNKKILNKATEAMRHWLK